MLKTATLPAPSVLSSLDMALRWRASDEPGAPMLCHYTSDAGIGETAWFGAADVDLLARRVGRWLSAQGAPGDRVLLCLPPGVCFTGALFGCFYSGRIAVPVPVPGRFSHERRRIAAIAVNAGVSAVLTESKSAGHVSAWLAEEGLSLPALDVEQVEQVGLADDELADNDTDTLAVLQYTSGSTGLPKGVMLSHGNLLANIAAIARALDLAPGVRVGGWLPNYHDMGLIGQLLTPIVLGGSSVTMDPMTFLRRPYLWLRMIDEVAVEVAAAPNFAYEQCTRRVTDEQLAGLDLSRWEVALNGSETVSATVMERFTARFSRAGFRPESFAPAYGLAESTLLVTGSARRRPVVRKHSEPDAPAVDGGRSLVSCGRCDGADVRIVDPGSRSVLVEGEIGEVWVRGGSVSQGYWNAPELTAATFGGVTVDGEGHFLRTGDLGLVENGELYLVGRMKEIIVIRGMNLHPHDLEEAARARHPQLSTGCGAAFGVSHATAGELLVLAHEVAAGAPREEFAGLVSSVRLMVAREFGVELDGMLLLRPGGVPRTTSGKIQRGQMRSRFLRDEITPLHSDLTGRLRSLLAAQPTSEEVGS
ncbi:fatty acyl-AMP ligase [Amycolatopsis pigmentata]|uniref:Fatty acyl-AMP ligase n=1 Tax=Amycolatopsis pigmentata TaxID=450801 RepID=A0ABW5G003_9PSEU